MERTYKSSFLILILAFFFASLSFPAASNTSGILSLDFPRYGKEFGVSRNVTNWKVEGQSKSSSKAKDGGLGLTKEGSKLVVEFELPFKPQKAVLHINHRMEKPEEVELKNEPYVRFKANGSYIDQHVETDPPGAEKNSYWIDRWHLASSLKKGKNKLTFVVPNHYSHYYIRNLTIAYNAGRFMNSGVILATTVWNRATLEYKKSVKDNIPGIAFYFYTLQRHKFIGGGEIYLDQAYVIPSVGERIELPYKQPSALARLYLNYLGSGISKVGVNPLRMVAALNRSVESLHSALVRHEMKPNHANALTQLAKEIFNYMMM